MDVWMQSTHTSLAADFQLLAESLPQIVWVQRRDGALEFVNSRGLAYVGRTLAELASPRDSAALLHRLDRARALRSWREAIMAGSDFSLEARLRRRDGSYRWHLIQGHPLATGGGAADKWIGTATDVHDVKESQERSAFLLALSTELARISDPHELLWTAMLRLRERLHATRATRAEFDYESQEAILLSQCEDDAARIEISTVPLESYGVLALQSPRGLTTVVHDVRRDGRASAAFDMRQKQLVGAIVSVPLLRGGSTVALFSIIDRGPRRWSASDVELIERVADIVWPAFEKARADRERAESEERLRLAQSVARVGAWEWDTATDHCFLSPECYELFGVTPEQPYRLQDLLARVEPADLPKLREALTACLESDSSDFEYRYQHPEKGWRWIHSKTGTVQHGGRARVLGIHLDVTERKHAEEALQEINQRKDEFLAMLAHELRNPLAPIRNAAQILRVHAKGNSRLEWARAVIERQSRHLTRLVDDLLDVSRIVRGQITLERNTVELAEVVRNALETARPLVRERRHELTVILPEQPVYLDADLTRLSQVLANLLINAAKYTPEGGRIWLDVQQGQKHLALRVRDTGMGIAPGLLPHVFELFTQGARTLDRAQGGLGIGLTLVKRIVEMHGGIVEARSAGPGCGSEFLVRLPFTERPPEPEDERAVIGSMRREGNVRVLVVDDNVDAAESIAMLLRLEGHDVRSVHGAQAALEAAVVFRPHVVLLDIGLPGMDGYEVARRLRSQPAVQSMRLVAVTGYGQQSDRDRAREAGFDQHLVKPVEPEALQAVLQDVPHGLRH